MCAEWWPHARVGSLLPPGGSQGLNSACPAWLQVPLHTKPSCCPVFS